MIFVKENMTRDEARAFVLASDARFRARLDEVSEEIIKSGVNIIGLTGPSCSGKTTMAEILISHLEESGRRAHVISLDDFFFENEILNTMNDGEIDYDSPDTIDIEALRSCVRAIFNYEEVTLPKFDFLTGKRVTGETIRATSEDMFIFEGIQVLYPNVVSILREYDAYKCIYIAPESDIYVGGKLFRPNEIRLLRRIVRDYNFRGSSADFTLYLWKSVRENEEINIFPHIDKCDFFIDSTMGYDVNMLAPYLRQILSLPHSGKGEISEEEYLESAGRILGEISGIDSNENMEKSYLSENSLYREFI